MSRLDDLISETLSDPRHSVPVDPGAIDGALNRAGRIRRRRAIVATMSSVAVVAVAVALVVPRLGDHGKTDLNIATSPSTGTTQPAALPNTAPPLSSPLFTVDGSISFDALPMSAALGADSLYVAVPAATQAPGVTVQRIDRGTLSIASQHTFAINADGARLALAGDKLWLVPGQPAQSSTGEVFVLDAQTLDVVSRIPLDSAATTVTATGNGVWVSTQDHLLRFDAAGNQVASVSIPGALSDASADLVNSVFYTVGQSSTSAQLVAERDIDSGVVVATFRGLGPGGGHLDATSAGVWFSRGSGMAGTFSFLSRDGLHEVSPSSEGAQSGSNQISASAAGQVLWVNDVQAITCADPGSGAIRSSDAFDTAAQRVVTGDAAESYVLVSHTGTPQWLYAVSPSAACSG